MREPNWRPGPILVPAGFVATEPVFSMPAGSAGSEQLLPEPVDWLSWLNGGLAVIYGAVVAVSLGFLVVRLARLRRFCQSRPVVLAYVALFCAWWLLRNLL